MSWEVVVFALVIGATLFGCMAIEPTGTLVGLGGAAYFLTRGEAAE